MRKSQKKEILKQMEMLVDGVLSHVTDGYDQGKLSKDEYQHLMSNKAINLYLKCKYGNKSLMNRTKITDFQDSLAELELWKCDAIDVLWANHIFYEE